MIDDTKENEALSLNSLKVSFLSLDQSKSLENELNQIEETFRHPNLLVTRIKEMQRKQNRDIVEIQFKLNEMLQVKDDIKETNVFKPNLSLFDENSSCSFGSIKLKQYSNMSLFKSRILNGEQQCSELLKLCEFSPSDKFTLLYRGTRDGFDSDDFHSKCDGHSNTLTILKANGSGFIFGGFTTVAWDSSSGWKSDPNAFLFSLTNKDNRPVKKKYNKSFCQYAIGCDAARCGPIFGRDNDIHVANNANTTWDSHCKLEIVHKHPNSKFGIDETKTFSSQPINFQLDEIEVYQKRINLNKQIEF